MTSNASSFGKTLSNIEKKWFPWRKNRLVHGEPAFFPGCNLVNFLPETARATVSLMGDLHCGWLYDCCGKPLLMSGDPMGALGVLERAKDALKAAAVPELIVACPNCFTVFQKELDIPVKDIYTFLKERNIGSAVKADVLPAFPPCPDRGTGAFRKAISEWSGAVVQDAPGLPCCGLGISDPQRAKRSLDTLKGTASGLHPYCASCYGHLSSHGVPMNPHILSLGLDVKETAAQGLRKGINRTKPWGWK